LFALAFCFSIALAALAALAFVCLLFVVFFRFTNYNKKASFLLAAG